MGAVKKLDIEGFCARTDSYFAGMGESCSLDVGTKWETLKYVDDAIMEADRALFETPLEEFHGHGYESLRPELEREEADMKVLAAYPNLLRSELYENVDHKFMIGIRNKDRGRYFTVFTNINNDIGDVSQFQAEKYPRFLILLFQASQLYQ